MNASQEIARGQLAAMRINDTTIAAAEAAGLDPGTFLDLVNEGVAHAQTLNWVEIWVAKPLADLATLGATHEQLQRATKSDLHLLSRYATTGPQKLTISELLDTFESQAHPHDATRLKEAGCPTSLLAEHHLIADQWHLATQLITELDVPIDIALTTAGRAPAHYSGIIDANEFEPTDSTWTKANSCLLAAWGTDPTLSLVATRTSVNQPWRDLAITLILDGNTVMDALKLAEAADRDHQPQAPNQDSGRTISLAPTRTQNGHSAEH